MSGQLYPNLIGLTPDAVRSYMWKTLVQEATSGKQSTIQLAAYPRVHFTLTYELLRDNVTPSDLKSLAGLHNVLGGRFDTFLYTDPDFNTVASASPQAFFTGTGSALGPFQLVAPFQNSGGPGAMELVQNLNGTPVLYDNGSPISAANYTIGPTGLVTFGAGHALANTHIGSWSGSFYYRCRFNEDTIEWTKFMNKWWQAKVVFTSVIL